MSDGSVAQVIKGGAHAELQCFLTLERSELMTALPEMLSYYRR